MAKIEIPEGVIDQKQYLKYIALQNHSLLRNPVYVTSEGEEISIKLLPHFLRRQIEHLPPKEQEIILELKSKYNQLQQRRNVAKATAFGRIGAKKKKTDEQLELQRKAEQALEHDIVTLLGRMFSINEVVKILAEDNGLVVTHAQIKDVLARNLVTVERKREEFRNKVTDVRLYNKRPRLEELAWMYSKMKMRYITMNSTDAYNAMLRTLEQLRKEAEGDILSIKGAVDVNLNVELQAHIQKEIIKTINIKEIILGRIAARMNYDTTKLIAGLHNSYYNQFVQISGDFDPNAEMQYPSLINYDFADIERKNAERDDVVDIQAVEVTEPEHDKASSVREMFLKKIRAQQAQYESRTSTAVTEEAEFTVNEDYEETTRKGQTQSKKIHKKVQQQAKEKK